MTNSLNLDIPVFAITTCESHRREARKQIAAASNERPASAMLDTAQREWTEVVMTKSLSLNRQLFAITTYESHR